MCDGPDGEVVSKKGTLTVYPFPPVYPFPTNLLPFILSLVKKNEKNEKERKEK